MEKLGHGPMWKEATPWSRHQPRGSHCLPLAGCSKAWRLHLGRKSEHMQIQHLLFFSFAWRRSGFKSKLLWPGKPAEPCNHTIPHHTTHHHMTPHANKQREKTNPQTAQVENVAWVSMTEVHPHQRPAPGARAPDPSLGGIRSQSRPPREKSVSRQSPQFP